MAAVAMDFRQVLKKTEKAARKKGPPHSLNNRGAAGDSIFRSGGVVRWGGRSLAPNDPG